MTVVVDASVVVAALVDDKDDGRWAAEAMHGHALAAPTHLLVEATNVLRRLAAAGEVSHDSAALAHADLLDLRVDLFAYAPLATRCWELRDNLTAYDAAYVALAEQLGVGLLTLDERLRRAPGPTCEIVTRSTRP